MPRSHRTWGPRKYLSSEQMTSMDGTGEKSRHTEIRLVQIVDRRILSSFLGHLAVLR